MDGASWGLRSNHSSYELPVADMRPVWRQLIVIGNGFDLECDLPSKFEDFFSSRYDVLAHAEEKASVKQPWGAYLASHGLTAWNVIIQAACRQAISLQSRARPVALVV